MPLVPFVSTIFASLLLAAHFLRVSRFAVMVPVLLFPLLFTLRRPWSRRLIQAGGLVSAGIWIDTALRIRLLRVAEGEEWGRMLAILAAVAVVSLIAPLTLEGKKAKSWFMMGSTRRREDIP